jgi:DNA mismatch repair protein MutL
MGMTETDARMSLERHATSKIRKAEDLFTLHTMGFRGEALASIAAVSQMEMKTRRHDQELGVLISIEGSEIKKQEPTACEKGTSISIKNLFYNIPARRNFLKSNAVEVKHIVDEFQHIALAYPEIGFVFVNADDVEFDLPPGKLSQRIVNIFGKSYQKILAPCQEETALLKIQGYVGPPESAKKTRGEQFFFVNNRFIRNNYLNHAVMSAFQGLISEGSFPFYVLFITIDPKHIDVNVHPTKTEIKFDDERTIYGVVMAAVRQALGTHNLSPVIDFTNDVNILNKLQGTSSEQVREIYFDERFQTSFQKSNLQNWEKLLEGNLSNKFTDRPSDRPVQELRFESAMNQPEEKVPQQTDKWLVQLHNRFILKQVRSGIMIIDQNAAHERILFNKNMMQLKTKSGESQQSLFPQTIDLAPSDFALVLEMTKEISALGFRFEVFGKNSLLINGIPTHVQSGNERELFEGLLEQFKINQSELSIPIADNLAQSLARRAAIKSGQILQKEEMQSLIDQLFACKTPNYGPDGKQVFFIFELNKIENQLSRH